MPAMMNVLRARLPAESGAPGPWYGQTDVPDGLRDIMAISAGGLHMVALKSGSL
jgi:hypothetical protein